MAEPGLFKVVPRGLVPANTRTQDAHRTLPAGDLVSAKVLRERTPQATAKANAVFAHLGHAFGVPAERVKTELKRALGYVDLVQQPDGQVVPAPRSMAFDAMDGDEWDVFWREAEAALCQVVLPGMPDGVRQAIYDILNGHPR